MRILWRDYSAGTLDRKAGGSCTLLLSSTERNLTGRGEFGTRSAVAIVRIGVSPVVNLDTLSALRSVPALNVDSRGSDRWQSQSVLRRVTKRQGMSGAIGAELVLDTALTAGKDRHFPCWIRAGKPPAAYLLTKSSSVEDIPCCSCRSQ